MQRLARERERELYDMIDMKRINYYYKKIVEHPVAQGAYLPLTVEHGNCIIIGLRITIVG